MKHSGEVIPFAALQVIKACKELEKLAQTKDPARIEDTLARIREARSSESEEWRRPSDSEAPFQ